jgi:4'-phosphopantetheinyl transferase
MSLWCAYYDVSELEDPALMSRGLERLPWPERRQRVGRYRFAADQRLCLGAGLLAAHMLRRAGASDLSLGYAEHGKPYLVSHPSIHFNLSHAGNLAVCAVSDAPVGVDVEVVRDHDAALARHCLQGEELDWLARADDPALAFTRLWVRKESYVKLTGSGLSCEPRTFSALPGNPTENGPQFNEFIVGNALLCVCAFDEGKVRLTRWSSSEAR